MTDFWLRLVRVALCVIFVHALIPKRPFGDRMGITSVLIGILVLTQEIAS